MGFKIRHLFGVPFKTVESSDKTSESLADLGSTEDEAATTDTGTFSIIALFKRLLQKLTAGLTISGSTARVPAAGDAVAESITVDALLRALRTSDNLMQALSAELDANSKAVLRQIDAAPWAYESTYGTKKQTLFRRETVLTQTHNAVSISATAGNASSILDCRGFDAFAAGYKTDASHSGTMNVLWYADSAGTNFLGSESLLGAGTRTEGVGRVSVKAPYAKLSLVNNDVSAHTMSSWTTLIP